jgi:AcrR family transcriptional regulator
MVKAVIGGKRQRTREALVEATRALIAERGLAAVTLDEVAARIGVTKGAIYSSFRGKGELIWAATAGGRRYLAASAPPGASIPERARAAARAVMDATPRTPEQIELHHQLQIYAAQDPELRAIQAADQRAIIDSIVAGIEAEYGERLRIPARALGVAYQALVRGFLNQWLQTPDEVTEDVVAAAFEVLLTGAMRPR